MRKRRLESRALQEHPANFEFELKLFPDFVSCRRPRFSYSFSPFSFSLSLCAALMSRRYIDTHYRARILPRKSNIPICTYIFICTTLWVSLHFNVDTVRIGQFQRRTIDIESRFLFNSYISTYTVRLSLNLLRTYRHNISICMTECCIDVESSVESLACETMMRRQNGFVILFMFNYILGKTF